MGADADQDAVFRLERAVPISGVRRLLRLLGIRIGQAARSSAGSASNSSVCLERWNTKIGRSRQRIMTCDVFLDLADVEIDRAAGRERRGVGIHLVDQRHQSGGGADRADRGGGDEEEIAPRRLPVRGHRLTRVSQCSPWFVLFGRSFWVICRVVLQLMSPSAGSSQSGAARVFPFCPASFGHAYFALWNGQYHARPVPIPGWNRAGRTAALQPREGRSRRVKCAPRTICAAPPKFWSTNCASTACSMSSACRARAISRCWMRSMTAISPSRCAGRRPAPSMMAEAIGKVTGRPGVCFVTRGPAPPMRAHGIHIAQQDSSPLVMFVGQVARDMREREAFQELDYRAVFGAMTKWTTEIDDPARVPEIVSRAFYTAANGRPGPVVIAIPEDMLVERIAVADAPPYAPVETSPGPAEMAKFAELLGAAQRADHASRRQPLVGRRLPTASAASRKNTRCRSPRHFAAARCSIRRIPATPAISASGPIRNCSSASKSSDLVVMIGGRLGELPSQGYTLFDIPRPQVPFVHVHPGAEELGRVYSPQLAIHATPTAFAAALEDLKFAARAVGRRQDRACRLSAMDGQGHRAAGRRQFRRGDGVAARKSAGRRHPVQRRRQLCGLDSPLLPLPPFRPPRRAGFGLDGLWRAGRGGDEAALSAAGRSCALPATAIS